MENIKNKNNQTKEKDNEIDWKGMAFGMIKNFFENLFSEFSKNVKQKIDFFVSKFKNSAISLSFVVIGIIFVAVGTAMALNFFIGLPGLGYLIIGLLLVLFGVIMRIRK